MFLNDVVNVAIRGWDVLNVFLFLGAFQIERSDKLGDADFVKYTKDNAISERLKR